MNKIEFFKYHGTGNDFILINNLDKKIVLKQEEIIKICDRHFGIGSDGIVLLEHSDIADYNMNFYNPDGSQSFCGNGSRCAFKFAIELGLISSEASFIAIDGMHLAKLEGDEIAIKMHDVNKIEISDQHYFIDTGSPHYIAYSDNIDEIKLIDEARKIRYNDRFREVGTNVNFVEEIENGVKVRTYERGVENETLSCGTGVTAVGLTMGLRNISSNSAKIKTAGGDLNISFKYQNNQFTDIWLKGPAKFIFQGEIAI